MYTENKLGGEHSCFSASNVVREAGQLRITIAANDGFSYDYLNLHFGPTSVHWNQLNPNTLVAIVDLPAIH